jgi:glycosyltransferase involved in cell wall biosynthesis
MSKIIDNDVTNKKISVCIPVYNGSSTIADCLKSIQNQEYSNKEIIVIDDGSTDNSGEIAKQYADVVITQENKGKAITRNIGAKASTGEIIAFIDSDCIAPSDWLSKSVKNLSEDGVRCCGGGYLVESEGNFIEQFAGLELYFRRENLPKFVNTLVTNNFVCYKDIFNKVGGFPENNFNYSHDMELSYQISKITKIIWDHDNPVIHHHRSVLKNYLKQQYNFSKNVIISYVRIPKLIVIKTHHDIKLKIEFISSVILLMLLVGFLLFPLKLLLLPILLIIILQLLLNIRLIIKLSSIRFSYFIKSILLILLRDMCWLTGAFAGTIKTLKYYK